MSAEQILNTDRVDFISNRKMNKPPLSRLADSNNNALPEPMRATIKKLNANRAFVMLGDMEQHYQSLVPDVEAKGESIDSKKLRRFRNNTSCREHLLRFHMEYEGDGLFSYTPAWCARNTGRLYIVGGCLQSASRDLKKAAYSRMPGFRNYDAKACQVFIAMKLVERAGLDALPLIEYLEKSDPKKFYGEALGIPGESAKRIVIALCMGALLPKTVKGWQARRNSILKLLAVFAADDAELGRLLRRAWEVLGPMAECLKKWHTYLLKTYIPSNKKKGGRGFVLYNAVGMTLPLWRLRLEHPRYRWVDVAKVVAHLLQGLEQACIQEQIVKDEGCRVISIEHDGFIVNQGEADLTLWADITAKYGLAGMRLEEKPI